MHTRKIETRSRNHTFLLTTFPNNSDFIQTKKKKKERGINYNPYSWNFFRH